MTTLTPMLQFIQDKILLAVHPGCSIENTRKKEFYFNPGCKVVRRKTGSCTVFSTVVSVRYDMKFAYIQPYNRRDYGPIKIEVKDIETFIGLPPTLSRVLTALGIEFYFWNGIRHAEKISNNYENRKYICDRKLLNENNTDSTLFDQSEETQKAIALLLGWKDVTSKNN